MNYNKMLFDNTAPLSASAMPPSYYTGGETNKLKLLGFKEDGTRNTWGQILGWHPGLGAVSNVMARNTFQNDMATDSLANQQVAMQRDMNKGMFTINAGLAVAGGVTGNPQLTAQGITGAAKSVGGLVNPPQNPEQNPRISYLNPYNF